MPTSWLVSITRSSCLGRLSLISVLTAVVAIITSTAGLWHPLPPRHKTRGRKTQVSGLGGGNSRAHCLIIPHLPHQDDVYVLPECRTDRFMERKSILIYLPLFDDAFIRRENVFYGVLHGNYFFGPFFVDEIDDRCQRS